MAWASGSGPVAGGATVWWARGGHPEAGVIARAWSRGELSDAEYERLIGALAGAIAARIAPARVDAGVALAALERAHEGRAGAQAAALAARGETLVAKDDLIAELRRRAEAAEVERDRLIAAQAAPEAPGRMEGQAAEAHTPDAPRGFLARVRRFFGGGDE